VASETDLDLVDRWLRPNLPEGVSAKVQVAIGDVEGYWVVKGCPGVTWTSQAFWPFAESMLTTEGSNFGRTGAYHLKHCELAGDTQEREFRDEDS
jgi:hypothetical protein